MRESFIFYKSFYEALRELPDQERLVVIDAMMAYQFDPDDTTVIAGIPKTIFTLIKPQLDKDNLRTPRPFALAWKELRSLVFKRDSYTCTYCGQYGGALECDHVVPVSRGGSNEVENLATACRRCNRSKKDKLVSEWIHHG